MEIIGFFKNTTIPKHRSRFCTQWKADNNIESLEWSSQSPDPNPIENASALMKLKLQGSRSLTGKQLSAKVKKIWHLFTTVYAENIVKSMPNQCQSAIYPSSFIAEALLQIPAIVAMSRYYLAIVVVVY